MQSNYGVSEIQQFMVEGGFSSLFSISTADMNSSPQPHKHHHHAHQLQQQHYDHHLQQQQQYHHQHQQVQRQHPHNEHPHFHHHHHAPPLQPPPLPFPQFPVTQQLFEHTHQFHLFQQEQQQRRMQQQQQVHLELDKAPAALVNSGSPARILPPPVGAGGGACGGTGVSPFLARVNFNLDVNESTGGGSGEGLEEEEDAVKCNEGTKTRLHPWSTGEVESAIKEPFWRPLDVDYINRNSKRCTEKLLDPSDGGEDSRISRDGNNADDSGDAANNFKLFSELEAICKPGSSGGGGGSSFGGGNSKQHTAASFSALLDNNPPPTADAERPELRPDGEHSMVDAADQGSNGSTAQEEENAQAAPKYNKSGGGGGGTSRKRKRKQQLRSVAKFLENLVRRLMEHQERLHRKFVEVLERRDEERMNREEMRRQQETAKASREATARAQEQALASTREAAIISFLEKITGEKLNLPTKAQIQEDLQQKETNSEHMEQAVAQTAAAGGGDSANGDATAATSQGLANSNRWPKAEVQALIRVRSSLEWRFQEPGLKGLLWEEVSAAMVANGYHRSAKRCKEKWENINKYFRRSKDSAKKRPPDSKTCPYFHQLDQLYFKTTTGTPPPASAVPAATLHNAAIVVSNSLAARFDQLCGVVPTTLGFHDRPAEEDDDGEDEAIHRADVGREPPALRRRGSCHVENDGGVDEREEDEGDQEEEEGGEEGEEECQEQVGRI